MRGTFTNVKSLKKRMYWSIIGEDGRTYFCHFKELVDKNLWKDFCYNGNTCQFDPVESISEDKNPVAKHVSPTLIRDPKADEKLAYAQECARRAELNQKRKLENKIKQEKLQKRKAMEQEYVMKHLTYAIGIKLRNSEEPWRILKPTKHILDLAEIKEQWNQCKQQHPEYMFNYQKVIWYENSGIAYEFKHNRYGNRIEIVEEIK